MLTPYSKSKFVEKVYTTPTGEKFRVLFLVALVDGKIKISPVSAQPIQSSGKKNNATYLPPKKAKTPKTFSYRPSFTYTASPYNLLTFFTSQPTRAPSN